jgi:long-subunit fatty acid transport protein
MSAAALLWAAAASAQTTTPSPQPTPNFEDEFAYPQLRLNLDLGSGARALGMGGAFLARPDDATAASWNPAGLSYLRRPEVSVAGLRSEQRSRSVNADGIVTLEDRLRSTNPDFLAAAFPFELHDWNAAVTIGFQRVIPFGGTRDIARGAQVQLHTRGGFDVFAAGLGVQLSQRVRVGGTVNRWANGYGVALERDVVRPTNRETDLKLKGWNFNLGLIFSPWEDLNVGVVGKTPFAGRVSLERSREDFTGTATGVVSSTNSAFRNDLRLHFPAALGIGTSWRPSPPLTVSLDVTRTFWSDSWIENFFDVPPAPGQPRVFKRLPFPTLRGLPQADTQQIRAGVEYVVVRGSLKWPLRAGYVNDRQYFQAVDGPPYLNAFTVGTGLLAGPFLLDVAYVNERGSYDDANDSGQPTGTRWRIRSHRFFASLIYRLPER